MSYTQLRQLDQQQRDQNLQGNDPTDKASISQDDGEVGSGRAIEKHTTAEEKAYGRTQDTSGRFDLYSRLIPPIPQERKPDRHPYNFWLDQVERFNALRHAVNSYLISQGGKPVTLADMAREAFEDYISKKVKWLKKKEQEL